MELDGGDSRRCAALRGTERHTRPCPQSERFRRFSCSPSVSPRPVVQTPGAVRLYLRVFRLREHFLSLFDIFELSGDCSPARMLPGPRPPLAAGAERRLSTNTSVKLSSTHHSGGARFPSDSPDQPLREGLSQSEFPGATPSSP